MLKLYHDTTLVGTITNEDANGFDMHGILDMNAAGQQFKPVFDYFQKIERPQSEEPPFPDDQLENWYIENQNGERGEIGLPGVFSKDGSLHIMWRYF